jgi:hypothetical protein
VCGHRVPDADGQERPCVKSGAAIIEFGPDEIHDDDRSDPEGHGQ